MSSFSVLIVDDEEDARELVKVHLARHQDLLLVGEARNGKEAIDVIKAMKPEIVLLDIQMPEMNGIEVLKKVDHPPALVFVTAYDEFAVKAFELNAIDYLLKPFASERFDQTMEKAKLKLKNQKADQYQDLIDNIEINLGKKAPFLKRLAHRTGLKVEYIKVEEIILISSSDQYVEVFTKDHKYILRLSMDYLEEMLDPSVFFRTHRSHIISYQHVLSMEQYEPRNYLIHLSEGYQAKLSRDKKERLNQLLIGN